MDRMAVGSGMGEESDELVWAVSVGKEYLAKGGQIDYLGPNWKWHAARACQLRMM